MKARLLFLSVLVASLTAAQDCFPKSGSKLPKLINYYTFEKTSYQNRFYAMDGTDDFVIFGGMSTQKKMSGFGREDEIAIVARIDLDLNSRRWQKIFNGDG